LPGHALIIESMKDGGDVVIRSRCACGWTSRWEHWAFEGSGLIEATFMPILRLHWRQHDEAVIVEQPWPSLSG